MNQHTHGNFSALHNTSGINTGDQDLSDFIKLSALSSTATGLTYTSSSGVFSLTSGYVIPTTIDKTNWNTAYEWGNHSSMGYATTSYVSTSISNLVNSAPTTLDTLKELADALGDDPNFATTITTLIGTKEPIINKNTAFNQNFETSSSNIKMNGTVSVGTSNNIARVDHIHPSDTSKVAKSNYSGSIGSGLIGGWVRVAQSSTYSSTGLFAITMNTGDSGQTYTLLSASTATDIVNIDSLDYITRNDGCPAFTQARIVYETAANYYLEVYCPSTTYPATNININLLNANGWSLITPISGSIPSGYTSISITLQAGFTTSGYFQGKYKSSDGTTGVSGTISLAKLTTGGNNGSITVRDGMITGLVNPT
jgi:hypothetical protein